MRVLRPGQKVVVHERNEEPFGKIEGRIMSVTIFDDLSARYDVRYWSDSEPAVFEFSRSELQIENPEYLEVMGAVEGI